MTFERASGILLHPTSLPGEFGIGDLGAEAFEFCDQLAEAKQTYWQILPLGPTGYGDSPYQCFSAFAGNTLLISPEKLVEDRLIDEALIINRPQFSDDKVDYGGVYNWKSELLPKAYEEFGGMASSDLRDEFEAFMGENNSWLDDYSLYRSIKASQWQKAWFEWPDDLKLRDEKALADAAEELSEQVRAEKFYQFLFFRQWLAVRQHANDLGIKIIGDIPIFVALDSSDVWCNQNKFKLNADGSAKFVAGVPPDFFSSTGQLWGNPTYDWDAMKSDGFGWWVDRVRFALRSMDIVRVDHFRGFAAAWEVPGGDATAETGTWVDAPGNALFTKLIEELGDLPMIAEDLGVITPDVEELRDSFGLPGMKILQYAFGGDAKDHYLPHNYIQNCVAYTGTHDNDTSVGWWLSKKKGEHEREFCLRYLDSDGDEIHWDLIRAIWASVADTAIVPIQDVLGLDNKARMNLPATGGGNWQWRMEKGAMAPEILERLRSLTETYGRKP